MNALKTNVARSLFAAAVLVCAGSSHAQFLAGVAAPAQARTGEAVKVTVNFDVIGGMNCGLHLHWGDGVSDTHKINQAADIPLSVSHTYAKPGSYKIVAEPKRVGTSFKCGGANQEASIAVTGSSRPPGKASSASRP